MTNQNNNEKWREELMMLLHRITAEYTEWKYAKYLFSPLDDFIASQISQAEQRGKREEQDRIFEEGWKMMEYNHKSENQWDGLVCANIRINTIQMLLDRVREPLNCSQSKNNQLK